MIFSEIEEIVFACTYKPGWKIFLYDDGRPYIQIEACTLDSTNPTVSAQWKSAKTYLSHHMCRQEIVGAVFQSIERAELHEMREFFRYRGISIYNPHLDPDELVKLARLKSSFNMRVNAMSMKE